MNSERRRRERFQLTKANALLYTAQGPVCCPIVDISMHGLAFMYRTEDVDMKTLGESFHLCLSFDQGEFFIEKIPFRKVSDILLSSDTSPQSFGEQRRYALEFKQLNREQEVLLEHFMTNSSKGKQSFPRRRNQVLYISAFSSGRHDHQIH